VKILQHNLFEEPDRTQKLFLDEEVGENVIGAAKATKNGNLNRVRAENSSIHD
jgi:hypothetical protein